MIVCICANVSEDQIKDALAEGRTLEDLNVCQNCCICKEVVVKLVDGSNKLE